MHLRASHNSKRSDRASIAAVLAIFALLIQALLPSAAMAAQNPGDRETMVICTQMGVQVVPSDQHPAPQKGFAGLPCQHCLAAAHVVTLTPEVTLAPAFRLVADLRLTPVERATPSLARAPPRPPGQGPPSPNA